MSGLPARNLTFLLGIPFDPPLAGTITNPLILSSLLLKEIIKILIIKYNNYISKSFNIVREIS
jgi:putative effector of murein hydrolase